MDNDVQRTDMQTYTEGMTKRKSACVRSGLVNELGSEVFDLETYPFSQNTKYLFRQSETSFHLICVSRVVRIKFVAGEIKRQS